MSKTTFSNLACALLALGAYVGFNSMLVQAWLPYETSSATAFLVFESALVLIPVVLVLFGLQALGGKLSIAAIGIALAFLSVLAINGFSSGAVNHFLIEVVALGFVYMIATFLFRHWSGQGT